MTTTSHPYQSEFARRYVSEGEADAVLQVLAARGISVPDEVRNTIAGCTDLDQLKVWVRQAATADKVEDLDLAGAA